MYYLAAHSILREFLREVHLQAEQLVAPTPASPCSAAVGHDLQRLRLPPSASSSSRPCASGQISGPTLLLFPPVRLISFISFDFSSFFTLPPQGTKPSAPAAACGGPACFHSHAPPELSFLAGIGDLNTAAALGRRGHPRSLQHSCKLPAQPPTSTDTELQRQGLRERQGDGAQEDSL